MNSSLFYFWPKVVKKWLTSIFIIDRVSAETRTCTRRTFPREAASSRMG